MKNLDDLIYRNNFKARHGYDPGPYGEWDNWTWLLIVIFLVSLVYHNV
jgi:hypothetical protein